MGFFGDASVCAKEAFAYMDSMLQMKQSEAPIIHSITFHGNKAIKTSVLKKQLGISTGSVFNQHSFNSGVRKVQSYYRKHQYPQARASYHQTPSSVTGQIDIVITIHEGRKAKPKVTKPAVTIDSFSEDDEDEE